MANQMSYSGPPNPNLGLPRNPFDDTPSNPRDLSPIQVPPTPYSPGGTRRASATSSMLGPYPQANGASTDRLLPSRNSSSSDLGLIPGDRYSYNQDYSHTPYVSRPNSMMMDGDDEAINTQTVMEKFAITPDDGLMIRMDEAEPDDYLHNPGPNDKDSDCNVFNRRGLSNVGGLLLVVAGVLALFVVYPVVTVVRQQLAKEYAKTQCQRDPLCLEDTHFPLMKNIRQGLIDPDTPESAKSVKALEGKTWKLVFSDEFETEGRTFYPDDDPYMQAVDLWYSGTQDDEWYDPGQATTKDGNLELNFVKHPTHGLKYRSAMMQTWNKLCVQGGRIEAGVSMPGSGQVSGFWPGFWTMGNLGRPGYRASTLGMWPYSYHDECDAGITPNQSSPDGISFLPGMRLPACTCHGEDHPSPGKSRSAPEIDIFEMNTHALDPSAPSTIGAVSQSLQIAPFDVWYMPNTELMAIYNYQISTLNPYHGGPLQQSISCSTNINNDWYDGKEYQKYAIEYKTGAEGYITWFVGDEPSYTITGQALGPNGNIGQRPITMEPMAVVMNLGMGASFAPINKTIQEWFPAKMRFSYLRIYQDEDLESVSCDPDGYPTLKYIEDHLAAYTNTNYTTWEDAGYDTPKNSFMHEC